jgi:hypothetical protein
LPPACRRVYPPPLVCLCCITPSPPPGSPPQLQLPPSLDDDVPLVLAFRSDHPRHAIEVYWVDYAGQLTLRRVLGYVVAARPCAPSAPRKYHTPACSRARIARIYIHS